MNQYQKYKPSGIDWIGEIPTDWQLKKLKHITYLKARVGWHGLKADEFNLDEKLPYCITGTDFNNGIINWKTCYHISEERYNEDSYIQLKENDLLVTKDGTIGKVAVIKKLNGKAILNSGVFVMRPVNKQYNSEFMYWLIQSESFGEFIRYTSKGSTIIHLYQDTFSNWSIALPSYEEQTTIANFLDEKTIQIDKLITNKEQLIELLKEERTAIINEAVSGEGKNWESKKLKYIASINSSKRNYTFEKNSDTEVVFLPMEKVSEGGIINQGTRKKINEVSTGFTYFERDDVIVAKITPCFENGKGALLDNLETDFGFGSTEFHTIRASDKIEKEFLFFQTKTDRFMQVGEAFMTGSAGQKRVPTNFVQDFEIAVPTIAEQRQIVKHIQTETQRIDNTISKIEKEIELMNEYRTALISEVVTGKIKVI